MRALAIACVAAALLERATVATAGQSAPWPDEFAARLAALALLQSLNAELLSHDSATATLERWCANHRLAEPAQIVAERLREEKPASAEVRAALEVRPDDPLGYRRVRLKCGDHVLSEADHWYVPGRLRPEMNLTLETSDTPFGKAIAELHFRRRTLSARLLWSPLPDGWEMSATPPETEAGALAIPPYVLEHRAVLSLPGGEPISEVVETYTGEVLAFPSPVAR